MLQDHRYAPPPAFSQFGFTGRVWRCLARASRNSWTIEQAPWGALEEQLNRARTDMRIASNETICLLLAKNPDVIRLVTDKASGRSAGVLAVLPLNEAGAKALVEGRLDGLHPRVEWVCAEGEEPFALYAWLVFLPGAFGASLGAIVDAIEPMLRGDCPIFSRATNNHSAKLHERGGFLPASDYYPHCRPGLLVAFPQKALAKPAAPKIAIAVARTVEEIFKVFSVRSATYIAEQFCLYSEEFDGNDFCSTHLLGTIDGDAAGCVRLRFFDGFAKLERLAVRAEYRNSRLAYKLVRAALDHARLKGYTKVYGHSRLDLVRFWKVFGFKPIDGRPEFAFADVRYAEILLEMDRHPDAIALGVDPMIAIRPEGAWDSPGPFDVPPGPIDERRKALIAKHTRTVAKTDVTA